MTNTDSLKSVTVIEETALQRLQELDPTGESHLVQNLIELFHKGTPEMLEKIRHSIHQNDLQAASKAAHALRSSCTSLGALRMAELCWRIERNSSTISAQDLQRVADQLSTEFNNACEELKKYSPPAS